MSSIYSEGSVPKDTDNDIRSLSKVVELFYVLGANPDNLTIFENNLPSHGDSIGDLLNKLIGILDGGLLGGSGSGAVSSVNGETGAVSLDAGEIGVIATPANYTPLTTFIEGHLAAIDLALTSLTGHNHTVGATVPLTGNLGDTHFNDATSILYMKINDGSNDIWIDILSAVSSGGVSATDIEIQGSGNGLILPSPDGSRWRLTVDNTGSVTTNSI